MPVTGLDSLVPFELQLKQVAHAHNSMYLVLEHVGEVLVGMIQRNFDQHRTGGEYESDGGAARATAEDWAWPNASMAPLSEVTLRLRLQRGIYSNKPLIESGALRNSVRVKFNNGMLAIVGPTGEDNIRKAEKQFGSAATGLLSSRYGKPIPFRSPFGYDVKQMWDLKNAIEDLLHFGTHHKLNALGQDVDDSFDSPMAGGDSAPRGIHAKVKLRVII